MRDIALAALVVILVVWWRSQRWPPGLKLLRGFLSKAECERLAEQIDELHARLAAEKTSSSYTPVPVPFQARNQSRVMLQFGAYTNANRVENASRLEPMPEFLARIAAELARRGLGRLDTCCVNLYEEGQWIPAHVDNVQFDRPFVTVSLCSEQKIVFERQRSVGLWLPVGSALVVDGEAADAWRHSVPPVTKRRISLTFRTLSDTTKRKFEKIRTASRERKVLKAQRKREARTEKRKSQRSKPIHMTQDDAKVPNVEVEHVWRVYDAIAEQWHGTRYKAWPRVAEFARQFKKGELVADVGCGNGKNAYALCENGAFVCACDVSRPLLDIAKRETHGLPYDCFDADACRLPFVSSKFDGALSIAVLHHVSTLERRRFAVSEVVRILRVGGRALFYAWAREQRDFEARSGHKFASSDVLVPFHLRRHGEYWRPDQMAPPPSHATLDDEKNAIVLQRYCHVYRDGELPSLVLDAAGGHVRIDDAYYDQGNWAVACTKL